MYTLAYICQYATIHCFHAANAKHELIRENSLLTPILDNPKFPPGQSSHPLRTVHNKIGLCILHLLQDGKLLDLENLKTKLNIPSLSNWEYTQLHYFATPQLKKASKNTLLSTFEQICALQQPQQYMLSTLHSMLWENCPIKLDKLSDDWSSDTEITLGDPQWEKIFRNVLKGSINVSIQENNYKYSPNGTVPLPC